MSSRNLCWEYFNNIIFIINNNIIIIILAIYVIEVFFMGRAKASFSFGNLQENVREGRGLYSLCSSTPVKPELYTVGMLNGWITSKWVVSKNFSATSDKVQKFWHEPKHTASTLSYKKLKSVVSKFLFSSTRI
ncbi:hypothetical protein HELRODRAFT_166027 [Helobdella robusta]|uniref:Uncharacterized protein n=1 Tax=Helobdella robusta TaxID=6412 RepID=T1EXM0_HELRO|nr:hypothetical protein HELRODRAFT_166027 [Helobdella robusta]ESN90367.1 hypothetical protein HELRODRAFT_166027 [Helobdella robusta]